MSKKYDRVPAMPPQIAQELRHAADDCEAQRKKLNWPYLFRVGFHPGLDRCVVTVASFDHSPVASMLPIEEAILLRQAVDSVIGQMEAARAGKL